MRGISHVRFGVLRIPEEHEQQHGCIDGPESTALLLPYVRYPNNRREHYLSLFLDMDERDLRLYALIGDCRKPLQFHSTANLPCGSYKLVVEFVPHAIIYLDRVSWLGSVMLGKDPPPI